MGAACWQRSLVTIDAGDLIWIDREPMRATLDFLLLPLSQPDTGAVLVDELGELSCDRRHDVRVTTTAIPAPGK